MSELHVEMLHQYPLVQRMRVPNVIPGVRAIPLSNSMGAGSLETAEKCKEVGTTTSFNTRLFLTV